MVSIAEDMCYDWSKTDGRLGGVATFADTRTSYEVHGLLFISSIGALSRALERK
jgi:hypothetical protein